MSFEAKSRRGLTGNAPTPSVRPAATCNGLTPSGSPLYVPRADYVLIVAVMHLKRRPGYWRSRLTD